MTVTVTGEARRLAEVYAHSVPGRTAEHWEPLGDHLRDVAARCEVFGGAFGFGALARLAGLLHDVGKCSTAFQAYIAVGDAAGAKGPDHSTAGAREALRLYPQLRQILPFVVAGHHAGLADGADLLRRLDPAQREIPPHPGWEDAAGPLPTLSALRPTRPVRPNRVAGFTEAFLTRMLFSCLVDADRTETARFYGEAVALIDTPLALLRDRLRAHMAMKRTAAAAAATTPRTKMLAALRAEVLDRIVDRAADTPGLFTLTVPTGGGKTLASLAFALEHAVRHGQRRVIYVIPFTSIVEQSAAVFREALAEGPGGTNERDVLEHHAGVDWERAAKDADRGGRGADAVDRLQRAAETWAVPVVVTTAVQFFESLFANRTSRCRKLHNLAGSVIVLDEAQTMPLRLLKPCLAALEEIAANYGASVVLCTATQPALREGDGFEGGLRIGPERELAPDPDRLHRALRRVKVEARGPTTDEEIAARFEAAPRMLCIVNNRRHAQALFARIEALPGAVHLSTLMCPAHRRRVLDAARARLAAGEPVRIVSTSLIEAGVDIDLPEVWRASAGLESICQSAGRANREFRLEEGRVVVFEPAEARAPHDLAQAAQAAARVLPRHADDPLSPAAIKDYFQEFYWQKGDRAFDPAMLDGDTWPILPAIRDRADTALYPFTSIARAFRVIDETMDAVVVPWREADEDVATILARVAAMDKPLRADLRRLQAYTVQVPRQVRNAWLNRGALASIHPSLDEGLLRLVDPDLYDPRTGVRLDAPEWRGAEANVIS